MHNREFDIVIFGLTGYTGYYVAREILLNIQKDTDERITKLRWAVAGRSISKLAAKLKELNDEIPFDHESITKIQADSENPESLAEMAKRTNIVVNTVGPFRKYGRPVVEACIQECTNHLDIAAEFSYFEGCAIEYNEVCKKNDILVISTCGWDVIPVDIGIHYLRQNFSGTLHSVESYAKLHFGPNGYPINIGTLNSLINDFSFSAIRHRMAIRKQLNAEVFINKLPKSERTLRWKWYLFRNKHIDGWNILFPSCDKSVVHRTQRHNFDEYAERPVQLQTYFTTDSFLGMMGLCGLVVIMAICATTPWTRKLIVKHPKAITFGYTSLEGPTREQVDQATFKTVLVGKGWKETFDDLTKEPKEPMDKKVVIKVEGVAIDPAYKATAMCLVQCALTVHLERENMPKGGVCTPGFAFHNTKLIDRLEKNGLKFTVEKSL